METTKAQQSSCLHMEGSDTCICLKPFIQSQGEDENHDYMYEVLDGERGSGKTAFAK